MTQRKMNDKVKLFFAGDFCSKPSTSKITVSDELQDLLQSCDLRLVNFEVPLKPSVELPYQKRERFCQNDDAPDFLMGLGFNLFSMANNHTFDWGEEGFKKTKAALGDAAFGAGTYDEAYKVKVVEVDGTRIGFLGLSFAAYTGVFNDVANHEGLGCAYINDLRVNHDIIEAKKHVDYLFVLPHDGIEYIDVPMPETIARYRDFINYGADGVIGTHPHCPQGWEEYKGKPIFYSLGNFLFNSKENYDYRATNCPHWYEGLCVVMDIADGILSWEVLNTRNVDNLGIVIDHDAERTKHDEHICRYLKDDKAYNEYLTPIIKKQAEKDFLLMKYTFQPKNIKQTIEALRACIAGKIQKQNVSSDEELWYMLRNDLKRNRLLKTRHN